MRKKINWLRHLGVLFLTVVIFTIGIFIGSDVEQRRVQSLYTQLQEQDLDYQNLLTESNYIDYIVSLKEGGKDNVSCDLIMGSYYTSIDNLDQSRIKLENYINTGSVKTEEFARLKEHYSNIQIEYWILANKINNLCEDEVYPLLYFYADDETCPECEDQGVHLSYVKQKLGEQVLIFSLDALKDGPTKVLAQKYDVSSRSLPITIIDEQVYDDYLTNEEIFEILCDEGLDDEVCLSD